MKAQFYKSFFLVFISLFGFTSCSALFSGLYGMKQWEPVDDKTIAHYATKYGIPEADSYKLDTAYLSFLSSLDTTRYKEQIKNHFQPLQALYYDKSGHLKSFQVNCYSGGFPNLKWNRNDIMSTFLPKQQAPIDSIVPLQTQLNYLKPLAASSKLAIESFDFIVLVYWSKFMGRQSKRLIRFVQENCKLEKDKKVKILYANTDHLFSPR